MPMAKKRARKPARKAAKSSVKRAAPKRKAPSRKAAKPTAPARAAGKPDVLLKPVAGAESREVGNVRLDVGRAGSARIKRLIYPPGFRWSVDMKPMVGTDLCMHAHVGFLARGHVQIEFPDGCKKDFVAPQIVSIEPGHDGRVIGSEPAVLIEFDFEGNTVRHLGMPDSHKH